MVDLTYKVGDAPYVADKPNPLTRAEYDRLMNCEDSHVSDFQKSELMINEFINLVENNSEPLPECVEYLAQCLSNVDLRGDNVETKDRLFNALKLEHESKKTHWRRKFNIIKDWCDKDLKITKKELAIKYGVAYRTVTRYTNKK